MLFWVFRAMPRRRRSNAPISKPLRNLHPDKNAAAGETELFLEVQQAYEMLSNPKRRTQYDATLPPEEKTQSLP